jgi:hypothetical protein
MYALTASSKWGNTQPPRSKPSRRSSSEWPGACITRAGGISAFVWNALERHSNVNVHPIVQLARVHLPGSRAVMHVPGVPPAEFHGQVARYGAGLDHAAGEMPLALIKANLDSRATSRGYSAAYIVTDRRLFGRVHASNIPLLFTEVPYAYVTAPPPPPRGLALSVLVPLGNQHRKLYIAPKKLAAYLAAMVTTMPPAARSFGPPMPPPRAVQDPIGAWAAALAHGTADARTFVPLRVLFEADRRGGVDGAEALVRPMVELARGITYGRGSGPQGWRTVLPGPVLASSLSAMLGTPTAVHQVNAGTVMDFPIGAGGGTGKAIASSVVGLALFATVGAGWVSTTSGHKLVSIRAHITEQPDGAAFQLFGTSGGPFEPLSRYWWRAVDAIHQGLFRIEARRLLALALSAPDETRETLEPRVAQLLGPTSLETFYPAR